MSDYIITGIIILMAIIQLWTAVRSIPLGVAFYISVAGLNYFSVWLWSSWTLDRICGVILILAAYRTQRRLRAKYPGKELTPLLLYGIVITLLGMLVWPYDSFVGQSIAYTTLRGPIQILNWIIMLGVARVIADALRTPEDLRLIRRFACVTALTMCLYGIYQFYAIGAGLPTTGIRRPAQGITSEESGEQLSSINSGNVSMARPGALVGEPKNLGGLCVFWLALLGSTLLDRNVTNQKATKKYLAILPLIAFTLFLTTSTSAWAGAVFGALLFLFMAPRFGLLRNAQMVILGVTILTFVVGAAYFVLPKEQSFVSEINTMMEERSTQRLTAENAVSDMPEVAAISVLKHNPLMLITGAGLGGISFYISKEIGVSSAIILAPNNGILNRVCETGLIGLVLLVLALRRKLGALLSGSSSAHAIQTSFIGIVVLGQCLIFGSPFLFSVALGFILGRRMVMTPSVRSSAHKLNSRDFLTSEHAYSRPR
jgi:hypothetical protein